jgi:hypothetical protein
MESMMTATDLFPDAAPAAVEDKDKEDPVRFDWINLFCRDRFEVAPDWRWFSWERKEFDQPHEFMLVNGAVCHARFQKGKSAGCTDWKKRDKSTERMFVIRRAELEAFQREWQARTGKCFECYGTGQDWAGWNAKTGNRYRPCQHCKATGVSAAA